MNNNAIFWEDMDFEMQTGFILNLFDLTYDQEQHIREAWAAENEYSDNVRGRDAALSDLQALCREYTIAPELAEILKKSQKADLEGIATRLGER